MHDESFFSVICNDSKYGECCFCVKRKNNTSIGYLDGFERLVNISTCRIIREKKALLIYNIFTMKTYAEILIYHWRKCAILMIIGGIAGFLLFYILPHAYSASVYLTTAIDHNRTGSLDELEEDRMLGIAEDIINSDFVLQSVCNHSEACSVENFRKNARIQRTIDYWSLTVSNDDAAMAVTQARLWLETAYEALAESQNHARMAEMLEIRSAGLESCIQDSVTGIPPVVCDEPDFETLLNQLQKTAEEITQERLLSHGISSAILFGPMNLDHIDLRQNGSSHGFLTFFGSTIGLFLFLFSIFFLKESSAKLQSPGVDQSELSDSEI